MAVTIKRKTQGTAVINFIGAAVNIGLNFLLIPRYGIFGAAYATLTTFIIVIVLMFLYNQKLMKLYYEWKRIIKIIIVTTVIFLAGYLVNIESIAISIVYKVAIILLYPFLLLLLRFYTPGEIQKAKDFFRKGLNKLRKKKNT